MTTAAAVIAPSSLVPAIIGRCSSYLIGGMATAICAFIFIRLIFNLPMPWYWVLALPPLIVITCLSSFYLACFLGAFVALKPRMRNIVHRFETIVNGTSWSVRGILCQVNRFLSTENCTRIRLHNSLGSLSMGSIRGPANPPFWGYATARQ